MLGKPFYILSLTMQKKNVQGIQFFLKLESIVVSKWIHLFFFQFFSGFMHLQGSDQLILLSLRLTICISIPKYSIINMRIYMKIQNSRAVIILSSELMKISSYYASKKRIFPSLRTTLLSHKCETDKEKVMISGKK